MKRRSGTTLIELMLSMMAGSILMLLAITLVQQTFKLSQDARARTESQKALSRIALRFRSDVHLSKSVEMVDASHVTLHGEAGEIEYYVAGNSLKREQKVVTGGTESDRFVFMANATIHFEVEKSPERFILSVASPTGLGESPTRKELNVSAVVGRWCLSSVSTGGSK